MAIVQAGSINTTSLIVPDLYVQIVPPQNLLLNGVPTNVLGMVGSAQWGPVNQPVIVSNMADYARNFGAIQARKYDMGTNVATATLQGASNFRCIRVTDGTDVAAASTGVSTCITFAALYTGSLGNSLVVTIAAGSKAASFRCTVAIPGLQPEIFDNITGTGNLRGASNLISATASAGTTAAVAAVMPAFAGGTDGVATPATVATNLIGVDTVPRTGMYAMRGQGCSVAVLCDLDASATWTVQASFGLAEGIYMICTSPSGDTIANAVTVKASAGLDSYAVKLMFGDWIYWTDAVNGAVRLVSPQGFVAGRLANLSPEQSSLNKPLYGVVGSQKSGLNPAQVTNYSAAELQTLFQVGIDVIANPQPGGAYWGVRLGHNSSSNTGTQGDNYTRMTNYIATTLNAGMGAYVGRVVNTTLFQQIAATLNSFFQAMLGQKMLGSTDGTLPWGVICSIANNPLTRTALGYVQADVQVRYQAINEKFIVNLEGGQTVTVARTSIAVTA
jgi:hypothetical protein